MASLADLFVSYKSVAPTTRTTEDTSTPASTSSVDVETARSRLQSLLTNEDLNDIEAVIAEDNANNLISNSSNGNPEGEENTSAPTSFSFWYDPRLQEFSESTSSTLSTTGSTNTYSPTGIVTPYNRGNLQKEIEDLFKKNNINIRVTSGKRKAGAAGKAGSKSHHVYGNAVDITPGEGETWQSIRKKMTKSPEIVQFFHSNGLGVIDETDANTMAKTGATGKHYHIGPDTLAVQTWGQWTGRTISNPAINSQQEWTKNTYDAFKKGLKKEYGNKYDNSTYNRIATYMTYQAALESGYGEKANGYNYGGHKRNGKTVNYKTMDDFVKAHIKTLKKWDFMSANSLQDYINSLYQGDYAYSTSDTPQGYFAKVNGTTNRVNGYLGLSAKFGGKFTNIRQLYEESFSKYRRPNI